MEIEKVPQEIPHVALRVSQVDPSGVCVQQMDLSSSAETAEQALNNLLAIADVALQLKERMNSPDTNEKPKNGGGA